jgi:AraC-like DNA-binding protein
VLQLSSSCIVVGYVVAGAKRFHHAGGVTECREGNIFILDAGLHYEENRVGERGLYEQITFAFDPATLQSVLCSLNLNYGVRLSSHHSCPTCEGCSATSAAASEQLRDMFATVRSSMRHSALMTNDIALRIKLNELIYLMLSSGDNCLRHRMLRLANGDERRFVQIVNAHLFSDVSVETLASLTHRSTTSFKREFRRLFGTSPHRWLVEQRLLRARTMLHSTSSTVSEIAHHCGFANPSHFIKLFREHYGTTPRELRRQAQKGVDEPVDGI